MSRNRKDLAGLPETSQAARRRAARAITHMRGGTSLRQAARKAGTTERTVKKYFPSALRQGKKGRRYTTTRYDRSTRSMLFATPKGTITLEIKGSRSASLIGKYWNAFRFFASGRAGPEVFRAFKGKSVTVNGKRYPFVTDPDVVLLLATAEPVFEDIYSHVR